MEQVPADCVLKVVEKFKRRHPGRLDYTVINCWDLGVPQTRKRLIAGTPMLIEKLRRRRTVRRSVADVIAEPGGTHTRIEATASGTKDHRVINSWNDFCRPISRPAATVTARNGLRWATPFSGIEPHKMPTRDLLAIQSFPPDYELGKLSKARGRQGAGNALPPRAMQEFLRPLCA
jgi:site-specific DNA-cytosine methylase